RRSCEIFGNPIRSGMRDVVPISCLDKDRPYTGIVTALDVDLLVTDEKRTCQIDLVFPRGLQDHSRRRFCVRGIAGRNVGAKIRGSDQTVTELTRDFQFNGAIFINGEISTAYPALVRDDNNFETV